MYIAIFRKFHGVYGIKTLWTAAFSEIVERNEFLFF